MSKSKTFELHYQIEGGYTQSVSAAYDDSYRFMSEEEMLGKAHAMAEEDMRNNIDVFVCNENEFVAWVKARNAENTGEK